MKNEIRFTLESKQRPKLAQEIGNILGTVPHYERVPSCAYDIAGYRLDKEGVLHIPEGAEETTKDLIRQLRERGFQDDAEVTEEMPVQEDTLVQVIQRKPELISVQAVSTVESWDIALAQTGGDYDFSILFCLFIVFESCGQPCIRTHFSQTEIFVHILPPFLPIENSLW